MGCLDILVRLLYDVGNVFDGGLREYNATCLQLNKYILHFLIEQTSLAPQLVRYGEMRILDDVIEGLFSVLIRVAYVRL